MGPLLFATAAFASAFLIFVVQPMVGKRILPWFGGAPAVWTLCLAFYQTALFAGYAYAHVLIRGVRAGRQPFVHALLLVAALILLPVLPAERWKPAGAAEPTAAILAMLSTHVALPFVALAATGPLVQAWFARRYPARSPYALYAVSNLGSFLALVAYPFFLEPRLSLSRTGDLWSIGFVATAAAVLACAALARRDAPGAPAAAPGESTPERPRPLQVALWFLLPGCAVVILMGVTNALTLDVASVPFLWVVPLGVYLTTFVLCFASERVYLRVPSLLIAGATVAPNWLIRISGLGEIAGLHNLLESVQIQILVHILMLFGSCMVLHGELYRLRPPASLLTAFYLCLSAGGAFGGIFVGLLAPRLFDAYHELALGLASGWLLLLAARWLDPQGWLSRAAPRWRWGLALTLTAIVLPYAASRQLYRPDELVHQERSFFGVLRVTHTRAEGGEQRTLFNGSTLHGVQFPEVPQRPTSYFGVQTGIGLAFALRNPEIPVSIGVVGLGIGTLAAYARPGDRFRFYEIDPAVIRIARDERFFSYLAQKREQVEIVEGDARISLASEQAGGAGPRFDFLIVDAFSSDAIPVHLLTREAIAVYLGALKRNGLLAFHVSNRHFDLPPVLARLAEDAGLGFVLIDTGTIPGYMSAPTSWAFVSEHAEGLRALGALALRRRSELDLPPHAIQVRRPSGSARPTTPLWTDDYTDLLGAMKPLRLALGRGDARGRAPSPGAADPARGEVTGEGAAQR